MRILIYSANHLFGECLQRGLARDPLAETVTFRPDLNDIMALAASDPRVAVLIDLNGIDCSETIQRIRTAAPSVCILALAIDDANTRQVVDCARKGFAGLIPHDTPLEKVSRIVYRAQRGEVAMRPHAVAGMMRALHDLPEVGPTDIPCILTPREREICRLICEGRTNKEIALQVNCSFGTVKNHVHSILSKLDLPRRSAVPRHLLGSRFGVAQSVTDSLAS
jgi:two-component system, NarL family, nitrate/nitrite response regulator NarL